MRPFWADDFDMDLLKVIPAASQILGPLAERTLYTVGGVTHGRLNHPSVWNSALGMVAFFGTSPGGFIPPGYVGAERTVECTALEAFRDAWVHTYAIVLDHSEVSLSPASIVWDAQLLRPLFDRILFDRRGWRKPPRAPQVVELDLDEVTDSLVRAAERLREALAP